MSTGLYTITTRAPGTILTAAIYNADHQNHVTNQNPSMTGALSDDVAEMQTLFDPGGIGSENLPESLADELAAIRFALKRYFGSAQWYEDVGEGVSSDSTNTFSITQAFISNVVLQILRRTENDTTEREIRSVRSGSGVGDKYSERIVGDAANGVAKWREYIDETLAYELTNVLSKFPLNVQVGDSILIDEDGHFDLTEITAPATPGANVGRLYAKEVSPLSTLLAYKNDAGIERILRGADEAVGTLIGILEDRKAANTAGGTFTSGAWQTRDLQTETYDRDGILSLSSNQFTISVPGTYDIEWSAPGFSCNSHKTRLFDVTNTLSYLGTSELGTLSGAQAQTRSFGSIRVTIAGSTVFRIEHRCSSTQATNGFGVQANLDSTVELYTRVVIRRG